MFLLNANGYTKGLKTKDKSVAKIPHPKENKAPINQKINFNTTRSMNPSKLNSKIIPGNLIPKEEIVSHISGIKLLSKIKLEIKVKTKTEETKRTIPVLLSPLVKNTIPNTIQIKAAILDHTKE